MVPFVDLYVPVQLLAVPREGAALDEAAVPPEAAAEAEDGAAADPEPDAEGAGPVPPLSFEQAPRTRKEQMDNARNRIILRLGS